MIINLKFLNGNTKKVDVISGTTIKVDRVLPTLSAYSGTIITYYTILLHIIV